MSATFGIYMNVRKPNGSVGPMMFFNYVDGARKLVVYTNWKPATVPEDILGEYKSDLRTLFGPVIDNPEPNVSLAAVGENLEAFKDAVRKLRDSIAPRGSG